MNRSGGGRAADQAGDLGQGAPDRVGGDIEEQGDPVDRVAGGPQLQGFEDLGRLQGRGPGRRRGAADLVAPDQPDEDVIRFPGIACPPDSG